MRDQLKRRLNIVRIFAIVFAVAVIMLPRQMVRADSDFTSDYSQHTFAGDEGFDSGEANCVCQSTSGYIWIGTDNGIYRYDGSEFTLFPLDSDEDGTKYSINCIYLTSDDKLYVGTDNYGLYVYDNGAFNRVAETYNLGVSTINAMYEDDKDQLWLASSSGIYYLTSDGVKMVDDEGISGYNIGNISGYDGTIYATANNDVLIRVDENGEITVTSKSSYGIDDINSLYIDENGTRYYGSAGYSILTINSKGKVGVISTGSLHGINKIYNDGEKIWILADDGVGYITSGNKIVNVESLRFNESMSDMIKDFEGNYWFTSYRKGLLFLEQSKFQNVTMKYVIDSSIVNCVTSYNGSIFIGTDEGLYVVDSNGRIVSGSDNELVAQLYGISIRDLYVDSSDKLWIATYKIYGVIRVDRNWQYKSFNRSESALVSNSVNCITEMGPDSVAVGTENGISIIGSDETINNISRMDGLDNPDIISLYVSDNGDLYAGSNGAGIYIINSDYRVTNMALDDNQKMSVVTNMVEGSSGLWIGTDNGLYYREGAVRQITTVDNTNSIYDMILDSAGYLWIFGSRGMYRYYEKDILSSASPEYISFSKNDGIISNITEKSTNYVSNSGTVYVCCDEGLCKINLESEYVNSVAPKVRVASVEVDGKDYPVSDLDGQIDVPKNTNRITIKFSVLSYVNRADINVNYYLEGFESEKRTLTGTDKMEVEYTNLEGGTYKFVLTANNADGVECEQPLTFVIDKELGFFETNLAKMLGIILILLLILIGVVVARSIFRTLRKQNEQVEELSKKSEEAEKSNQAKNGYVNYLNHEIRAPLNNIISISEIAMRGCQDTHSDEYIQYSRLYSAGREILDMSDGISKLSNLKDDIIDPEFKQYFASDLIEELSEELGGMINRDLIDLKVSIEDKIPNGLIGDMQAIKEIIEDIFAWSASTTKEGYISIDVDWHMARNAENDDHTPETADNEEYMEYIDEPVTEISSIFDQDHDEIYLDFKISDTGLGVKEERLDTMFELDDSYERSDIGMFRVSLGLAIAKELVRLLDGEINVESIYGAGTTIRFSVRQSVFDYSYVNYNERKRKEMARRNANSHLWLPDAKILIVDDSEISLQVEKTIFDTYGLDCDTATSGFDALDKVMVNGYDVVFIDTVMPVMDGIDTVREIRNLDGEEFKKMPIVALSANTVETSREEILTSGFNDIIVKPIELDQAEAMLRNYVSEDKVKEKNTDLTQNGDDMNYIEDAVILRRFIAVEDTVRVMGGSFRTFNTFVRNYKEEYQEEVQMLRTYIDDDVRRYKNIIHDIKSSSANLGAYGIERKAANLESAINIGNQQYARDNTRDFVAMMNDFFKQIDKYMAKINHVIKPEEKEYRDGINKGKLKELRAFLRAGDREPVESLVSELDRYQYGDIDTEFFTALKEFVASGDYQTSSEMIDQYLNSQ